MCRHIFVFPEDKPENYNHDRKTITGECKCGATQRAYGLRWMVNRGDNFLQQVPYGESQLEFLDKSVKVW